MQVQKIDALSRLRLVRELGKLRGDVAKMSKSEALARLRALKRIGQIRVQLTGDGTQDRQSTAHDFDFNEDRKHGERKRDNSAAVAILKQIDDGDVSPNNLTPDQRQTLAKYSGTGGNLKGEDGKLGSAYEYYTPKPIAEGVWSLLGELGFAGGKVLDPCAGTGIFGATAPTSAAVDSVELNPTSGRINQILNGGAGYHAVIAPFESVAASTPDETHDAIVSNVPFGTNADRGGNQFKDPMYQRETLEGYFLLRALTKLKPGGLAAFIVPPRVVSDKGGKSEALRIAISFEAEFLGAYRLPNSVFGTADADTITDVVVFRKFSHEVRDKIAELRDQNPEVLIASNVQWPEFIGGKYFQGDGHRFVLGEFQAKDPNKFRDVDRVLNSNKVSDVAKLMKKFGPSRIDWQMLGAVETLPITYVDGDTVTQAGQTLQMRSGLWVAIGGQDEDREAMGVMAANLSTALNAVNTGVTYEQATGFREYMDRTSQAMEVSTWLSGVLAAAQTMEQGGRELFFQSAATGLACDQVMHEHQTDADPFNYLEGYPSLSEAMKRVYTACRASSQTPQWIKTAMKKVTVLYMPKSGFSGVWRGDVVTSTEDLRSADDKFAAAKYGASGAVAIEDAKAIYGDSFDPLTDSAWAVTPDGKACMRADDYFVGNYAEFLARWRKDFDSATSDAVRDKLVRQKARADERLARVDVKALNFDLFSPFVTLEEKAEFLRRFVDKRFTVAYEDIDGRPRIVCNVGSPKNEHERALKRFAEYLKYGSLTTRSSREEIAANPSLEEQRIAMLRTMARTANEQFSSWIKANPESIGRIHNQVNDTSRLYFKEVDDESDLQVPGMKPSLKLHGYQCAEVRRRSRDFGGINGFGVGLGKTFTALACIQHIQNIGVKKKTFTVVPNSVLSNWYKETKAAYESIEDCLFVGLTLNDNGTVRVDSKDYDRDLVKILENRHRKVFLTFEAFFRLRLRPETAQAYEDALMSVDASYADSVSKKESEKTASARAELVSLISGAKGKSVAAPYFEDCGVDSLVIDEAHVFKNAKMLSEFKGAKYLATSDPSARGLDAMAKAWYVRGRSPRQDGVLLLTATPITNSPLEIYSMLSLAVGEARVNGMAGGLNGADQFMYAVCDTEDEDDVTIDGQLKTYSVFKGLVNVSLLRSAIGAICTVKTAEDVGGTLKLPTAVKHPTPIALPETTVDALREYQGAFRAAIETLMGKTSGLIGDPEALERVMERTGEPLQLVGHPFNLINKMTMLVADPELDRRLSIYQFDESQRAVAEQVVAAYNAKPAIEERQRVGQNADASCVVSQKTVKDGDKEITVLSVKALAKVSGDEIQLDSIDPATQDKFDAMAKKSGLDWSVSIPPKLAALLENFQKEQANPRGKGADGEVTGRVKQIIFCDILPMFNKIRRLLVKHAGIPSAAIAVVTGRSIKDPTEIQDIQDGFNADGEKNLYRVILANEKAEVGINLQRGTQAIHHLTIGWTPDSDTQRNGRGVRQGNQTDEVNVYYYEANGTFDTYKRMLVGKKATWIDSVMSADGGEKVAIEGGLSREQQIEMINAIGDATAVAKIQERAAARDAEMRSSATQSKQIVAAKTIVKLRQYLSDTEDPQSAVAKKLNELHELLRRQKSLETRLASDKVGAQQLVKLTTMKAEVDAVVLRLTADVDTALKGAKMSEADWSSGRYQSKQVDATAKRILDMVDGERSRAPIPERISHNLRAHRLAVNKDSQTYAEWSADRDNTQAMIDESRSAFKSLSTESGGYSPVMLDAVEQGRASVIDGRLFGAGVLVKGRDTMGAFVSGTRAVVIDAQGGIKGLSAADAISGYVLLHPGEPGYDALALEIAQAEDEMFGGTGLTEPQLQSLPSASCDAVAKLRQRGSLVLLDIASSKLPEPYFPRVITPGEIARAKTNRLLSRLAAKQGEIVSEVGEHNFAASPDIDISKVRYGATSLRQYLLAYCSASGDRVHQDELEAEGSVINVYELTQYSQPANPIDLSDCDTDDAISERVDEFAHAALPFIEFHPGFVLAESSLSARDANLVRERRYELRRQAAKVSQDSAPAAAPQTSNYVAIVGDTRGLAKQLEDGKTLRAYFQDLGLPIAWKDRNGESKNWDRDLVKRAPFAPANSWVTTREAADRLFADHQDLCRRFDIHIISGVM